MALPVVDGKTQLAPPTFAVLPSYFLSMEILSHNSQDIRSIKEALGRKLFNSFGPSKELTYQLTCQYHGIPLCFHLASQRLKDCLINFLPKSWTLSTSQDVTNIYWYDSNLHFKIPHEIWSHDISPNCDLIIELGQELAIQRDFVGVLHNENTVTLISKAEIDDGFFNALRWLLPRQMLMNNCALLHSSCIVGRDNNAYFFLGPSGAGKSTVAELAKDRVVLGDDMNVLKLHASSIKAEPGALGQRISNPQLFSLEYNVAGLYWLEKSDVNDIQTIPRSEARSYLLSSFANLFWKNAPPSVLVKSLQLATEISLKLSMYKLRFNLKGDFWTYVDGQS